MRQLIAKSLLAATLGLTISSSALANGDNAVSSVKSQAMQCYTLYSMMMEEDPVDTYRNDVLGSQAMLMGTIYVWSATEQGETLKKEQFDMANEIARSAILATAHNSRDDVAERLINCEGWREEVISAMALSQDEFANIETEADIRRVIKAIPEPKASYPLVGVSRLELNFVIDEALARHLQE